MFKHFQKIKLHVQVDVHKFLSPPAKLSALLTIIQHLSFSLVCLSACLFTCLKVLLHMILFLIGGGFLVTGNTDHNIRIYQISPGPPDRIAELNAHLVCHLVVYLKL